MNKKIIKLLKIAMVICIIIALVFALFISQNNHHLDVCQKDNCVLCTIIHIAQTIINISFAFIIVMMVGFLIFSFLSRLRNEKEVFVQSSLVFQKVQLNE